MRVGLLLLVVMLTGVSAFAQIPKNDEKEFEYFGEASARRAGSGDLMKRFEHWANTYYEDAKSVTIAVDDSTERYIEIQVTEDMVESYFGVNRQHKNRTLSYHIKFDCDRKDYKYWINDFIYKATEIDKKGRETMLDGKLSELKTAASNSLEEEVHRRMEEVIASFKSASEKELEE